MSNVQFSIPAASVARLGSDFVTVLDPHSTPTLVTASGNQLTAAMAAGPAWVELSHPADIVSPGAFALRGLVTPSAPYLEGKLHYRMVDDALTMESEDGTVITNSTLPAHSAKHVSAPSAATGTVDTKLLTAALRALPTNLGSAIHFFDGGAFIGMHPTYCCVRSEKFVASWALPTALVRLVLATAKNADAEEVRILEDESRTGIAVGEAILHWPKIKAESGPPTHATQGWCITRRQAMHLGNVGGSEPSGSIDFREVDGELVAEVHVQGRQLKETMKFPRFAEGLPNFSVPCRLAAKAFKSFREPLIALGIVDRQLVLKEDRELFQFTYALPARRRRAC